MYNSEINGLSLYHLTPLSHSLESFPMMSFVVYTLKYKMMNKEEKSIVKKELVLLII